MGLPDAKTSVMPALSRRACDALIELDLRSMLGIYALMIRYDLPIYTVIVLFGLFGASAMFMVRKRHLGNAAREDLSRLIGVEEPGSRPK